MMVYFSFELVCSENFFQSYIDDCFKRLTFPTVFFSMASSDAVPLHPGRRPWNGRKKASWFPIAQVPCFLQFMQPDRIKDPRSGAFSSLAGNVRHHHNNRAIVSESKVYVATGSSTNYARSMFG